jgi:hypothetical protein
MLEAGNSANRVASAGISDTAGNVVINGGSVSVGAGGFGVIDTGSIANSTGVATAAGPGNSRYWSDTNGHTGYSTALTSGISAIYREQPVVIVTASAAGSGRVYDATTTTATLTTTGLVNGDTGSGVATLDVTSGGVPSALLNAGSYTLGVTNVGAGTTLAGLGYAAQAGAGSGYVITPATLTISGVVAADKTYDSTTAASLTSIGTLTGLVGSQTLALTQTAANFADPNPGLAKIVTVTYAIANGTGLASNYRLGSTTTTADIDPATVITVPVPVTTPAAASVGLTSTVTPTTTVNAPLFNWIAITSGLNAPPTIVPGNLVGTLYLNNAGTPGNASTPGAPDDKKP